MERRKLICERLKKIGYTRQRSIRLYGEKLHLVSDPVADEIGYSILAIVGRTGNLKHLQIPLPIVSMLERELELEEAAQRVA